MNPKQLYELFRHEAEAEGADDNYPEWDSLHPTEMLIWGRFCRSLQSQHGLSGRETGEQMLSRLNAALKDEFGT